MSKPLLRAEGIIFNDKYSKVLIQCDKEESFYRFPGGAIEIGETAEEAIVRELIEEFDLEVYVMKLVVINERIVEYDGKQRHECTLIHKSSLKESNKPFHTLWHKEHEEIKLTWKTIEELNLRPLYPEGILEIIEAKEFQMINHIVVRKKY